MLADQFDQTAEMHLDQILAASVGVAQPELQSAAGASDSSHEYLPEIGANYRLKRKLGQGGMGVVYLAEDVRIRRPVAIKILSRELVPDQYTRQRFQKEARLLAEVRHPHVANLLDLGEFDGTCFLVLELVDGIDLKEILRRHGPLAERPALQIIRDVASALAVAHAGGIVHRDLKPGNILVSAAPEEGESAADAVLQSLAVGLPVSVKLTDFGLARHIDQTESLKLTRTGALLGTPNYISPEQCSGTGFVGPGTDIYSLGATLFEMLAGRPPFQADDPVKLISLHCFEPPPDIRKLCPAITDGAAALVARMLEKSGSDRYADGQHLVEEIDRLLKGDRNSAAPHPVVPPARSTVVEAVWEWRMASSAEALWPYVSNTDRINSAIGLPSVDYQLESNADGDRHLFGVVSLGWARLRWQKHPIEWIEGRRFGILRQFENGPFDWFLSTVELAPLPEGGTRLTHTVQIAPRNLVGRMIAAAEIRFRARRPLDRVYRHIDRIVSGHRLETAAADAFVPRESPPAAVRKRLQARQEQLLNRGADPECVGRLLEFLEVSPAQELARIRPRALAHRLGLESHHFTTACLEACHVGLLELHWDVICPTCRVAASVVDTLSEIDQHTHCEACELDFDVDFSNAVELIFRAHPEFRKADLRTFCLGGPMQAPHVIAQSRLAPGERLELDLQLDPGTYVLRGPKLPYTLRLLVESGVGTGRAALTLAPDLQPARAVRLLAGRQLLALENDFAHSQVVRLERTVARTDIVTAAEASRLPVFRQLFPAEILSRDRLSSLSTSTLLAVRVTNVLELFSRWGDAETCERLRESLDTCRLAVESCGGHLIKEQDDGMLAAFPIALDAVSAALQLMQEPRPAEDDEPHLHMALHRGASLSTTINGRVDVFGRTIATTRRLLEASTAARLIVSAELAEDPEVAGLLISCNQSLRPLGKVGDLAAFSLTRPFEALDGENPVLN